MASRDMFLLDWMIMTNELPGELYRMCFVSQETQMSATRKAAAISNSIEGKAYIEKRTKQLESWYFNESSDGAVVKAKPKSIGEAFSDLTPTFIDELYNIMQDRKNENFGDTIKVFLAKTLKDAQMGQDAVPPLRYLPESCLPCRYKLFVEKESNDECEICRYKQYGEKHGLHYDHKTQLNPIKDV